MAPVADVHADAVKLLRELGIEAEDIPARLEARVAPLHEVDTAGHGTEVDALSSGPALYIYEVREERGFEELPGMAAVAAGRHPGVDNPA